eukprot:gnl/MRDRNA2_/MRDRNA2_77651_c0_seq1.p1 gnl/MRDRNA2_/MRDRNA2_77651_c0~~gnl/MRDRNA2_/MRDRNA2_77651_c0_seq1.p1  ORF type:complete len:590 (-),score=106.04 gnl/MRDRNA2_/MRDRNA2_77651_c0_seq1:113-1882(-)
MLSALEALSPRAVSCLVAILLALVLHSLKPTASRRLFAQSKIQSDHRAEDLGAENALPKRIQGMGPAIKSGGAAKTTTMTWSNLSFIGLTYNAEFANGYDKQAQAFLEVLQNQNANIAVVCTQEAKKPSFGEALQNEAQEGSWKFLSSLQHLGMTKKKFNHQELTILVKPDPEVAVNSPAEGEKDTNCLYNSRDNKAIACAKLISYASGAGKGGVVGWLELYAASSGPTKPSMSRRQKSVRPILRLAVTCAHFDATSNEIRAKNERKMLAVAATKEFEVRPEQQIKKAMAQAATNATVSSGFPQAITTKAAFHKHAKKVDYYDAANLVQGNYHALDAIIILGDLNYRIFGLANGVSAKKSKVDELLYEHLMISSGKLNLSNLELGTLGMADTLLQSQLVTTNAEDCYSKSKNGMPTPRGCHGFDFTCSTTAGELPTYKVSTKKAADCLRMRNLTEQILFSETDVDQAEIQEKIEACYDSGDEVHWSQKAPHDFQLGWLDRTCWRSLDVTRFEKRKGKGKGKGKYVNAKKYSIAEDTSVAFRKAAFEYVDRVFIQVGSKSQTKTKKKAQLHHLISDHFPKLTRLDFTLNK